MQHVLGLYKAWVVGYMLLHHGTGNKTLGNTHKAVRQSGEMYITPASTLNMLAKLCILLGVALELGAPAIPGMDLG